MSEWPKTANQIWAEIGDGFRYGKTEVIPADLAQELYEAVKTLQALEQDDLDHYQHCQHVPHADELPPESPWVQPECANVHAAETRLADALARYEREALNGE